ncbi:MAG TPA: FAD-dependent monooxygenase [Devosiaceae bacterium]|jgi:2-octaprenyl-6-methoxyphenol hydroxylase|nr:FAD-dependent monooxygenase [Devosiaceae bacterium]
MSRAARADAVIVGGGLVGRAAACAVAASGRSTVYVAPKAPPDRRTSALMQPSVDYLRESGLVEAPEQLGTALTRIRIIDATSRLVRAPETLFDSREAGLPAFGWNFPNIRLAAAFEAAGTDLPNLETRETTLAALQPAVEGWRLTLGNGDTLEAALVVGADGKRSLVRGAGDFTVREQAFRQSALVCDLELGRPLEGTSVEFHYPQGPFTLVPAGDNRANLVWIDTDQVLQAARAAGPELLRAALLERSHRLFGEIEVLTPSHVFPLSTLGVNRAGAAGIMLVGEAAHAFPPIGAQGLNLGLRDVADLAASLAAAGEGPGWARAASEDYARRRAADLARTGGMVDALFRSLLMELLPAQALRAGGLWALKLLPPLRRQAFSIGMGRR